MSESPLPVESRSDIPVDLEPSTTATAAAEPPSEPQPEDLPRILFGSSLRSLRQILATPIAPRIWEVEPLVIQGQRVMLVGQWGAFKSWLLQHLSLSLATAPGMWLGAFQIPTARRVLYLDKEMSEHSARRRFQRLAAGMKLDIQDYPFDLVSHPQFTMSEEGGKRLLTALDGLKMAPDVIVMETYRRVLKGKENDQGDVSAFWEQVEPIFKAGKTLYVSHHMRKPKGKGEDNRHMASGSTDVLAGADTVLAVTKAAMTEQVGTLCLEHLKGRDSGEYRQGKGFPVQIRFEGHVETGPVVMVCTNPPTDQLAAETPREQAQRAMVALARSQESVTTAQLHESCKVHGGQSIREEWLRELVGTKLDRVKHGVYKCRP